MMLCDNASAESGGTRSWADVFGFLTFVNIYEVVTRGVVFGNLVIANASNGSE